ncbi:MAG: hypothetical protein JOZ54_05755 [Acidobacteria bacterium]|nr:hypothetical protein [Acidobacteriota bacterium]
MPGQAGTLEVLARGVGRALMPLGELLDSANVVPFFADLGVQFPDTLLASNPQLASALETARTAAAGLPAVIDDLTAAINAADETQTIAKGVELLGRVTALVAAIGVAGQRLDAATGTGVGDLHDFATRLPGAILEYLVIRLGEDAAPTITSILVLLGLIDRMTVAGTDAAHPEHVVRKLRFDRFGEFFRSPMDYFQHVTGWGTADLTPLFARIDDFLDHVLTPSTLTLSPLRLETGTFELEQMTSGGATGIGFTIHVPVDSGLDLRFPLCPGNALHLLTEAHFDGGVTGTVLPPVDVTVSASAQLEGRLLIGYSNEPAPPATARILFGEVGGSRLEVASVRADGGINFVWDSATNTASVEPILRASITGGKVVIDMSKSDGFVAKLLGGVHVEGGFDTRLIWTPSSGFHFEGSATIEIGIPLHVSLGPIEISQLYLSAGFNDGGIPIELSVALGATLGPLQASIDRIGAKASITFPPGGGNAGPADVALAFKPPTGVGLGIDAGIVKGGGFLSIDVERGEYAGVLQLSIAEIVTVTAIGLITTKNPDGSSGFSLLVIITAEFGAGIQLGFGFVLLGVGGLLGLNRTVKLTPLTDGVKTGAIDNILFPHDVIANAARIISDLRSWFPPQQGTFLIGPMAKFGWGTPALVTASFGIIIEIPPGNIIILGVLRVALPTQDEALIRIQVAFIGAIEFDKKRLWFFASLFDSRILFLTIEGDFGLLIAWGDDANFVLSVGGFHPSFQPPPLPFPAPRRIAVSLIDTDFARVRIEGYFAVTSNTVQFGAAVEIFFGFDAFNIRGHLAFDALFQFSPFHFIISISASFSLTAFGVGLLSVRVQGSLSGPAPWEAKGTGSITILFFDISADFDVVWGDEEDTMLPPISVMPLFQAEIEKAANWRALPPASNNLLVSLRKLPESDALVLHPIGSLRIAQRALPLDITLDKVGNQKPSDVKRLRLSVAAGPLVKKSDAFEQFAPAQFQNFSDSDKLSQPAYADEHGGIELTAPGGDARTNRMVKRIVRYEQIVFDTNERATTPFFNLAGGLFAHFLGGAAIAKSALSQARKDKLDPFEEKVEVSSETYTVAFQADNRAFTAEAGEFRSEASAREFLRQRIDEDPNLADALHVIPSFERAA